MTVAPCAFAHGSGWFVVVAGFGGPIALGAGVPAETLGGTRGRDTSLWAFVLSCAITWSLAPVSMGPRQFDWARGAAGVLGWALFALAWAAPPLSPVESAPAVKLEARMAGRRPLPRGDAAYLALGIAAAAALQLVGWDTAPAERALLVRFVALATGLGLLVAVAEVASARFEVRRPRKLRIEPRRLFAWAAVVAVLVLAGLLAR